MTAKKKVLLSIAIALAAVLAVGVVLTANGTVKIFDSNPERASDPNKAWSSDDVTSNSTEFVKEGMPDLTYRIDGKPMVFSYVKSTRTERPLQGDGDMSRIVVDYYDSAEGYSVVKHEGVDYLSSFSANDYSSPIGNGERTPLKAEQAEQRIRQVLKNSDIGLGDLSDAEISINCEYYGKAVCSKGEVYVDINLLGDLRFFSVKRFADISQKRKAAVREKIDAKIAELENEEPQARYELYSEEFILLGDEVQATYTVLFYPDKDSDAHSAYQYCYIA